MVQSSHEPHGTAGRLLQIEGIHGGHDGPILKRRSRVFRRNDRYELITQEPALLNLEAGVTIDGHWFFDAALDGHPPAVGRKRYVLDGANADTGHVDRCARDQPTDIAGGNQDRSAGTPKGRSLAEVDKQCGDQHESD